MNILNPHDPLVNAKLCALKRAFDEALEHQKTVPINGDWQTRQNAVNRTLAAEKRYWSFKAKVR